MAYLLGDCLIVKRSSVMMMIGCVLFVVLVHGVVPTHNNGTLDKKDYYMSMDGKEFQSRQSRLITFNTLEQGDIAVELAFTVPFITIPIKKSVDMAKGAIANVNIGAILLAGSMAIGLGILVPAIVLFMSKKMMVTPNGHPVGGGSYAGYRSEDSPESNYNFFTILNSLDGILNEKEIDINSCVQRMICWQVKNSSKSVDNKNGQSSSMDKIIDGLATNKWIRELVSGTSIDEALKKGLGEANCSKEYRGCKITQKSLQSLAKNFAGTINSRK